MFQTQVAYNFCRRLCRDGTNLVVERHATHTHCCSHLLQTDLTAAHVLQHELFDVAHQLLVHSIAHRVIADGIFAIVLAHQFATNVLWSLLLLVRSLFLLVRSLFLFVRSNVFCTFAFWTLTILLVVVVIECGRRHTCVAALQSACLAAFDGVALHLDRTETHQFVEAHHGLLDIERLGQIVVGGKRDVLVSHILL